MLSFAAREYFFLLCARSNAFFVALFATSSNRTKDSSDFLLSVCPLCVIRHTDITNTRSRCSRNQNVDFSSPLNQKLGDMKKIDHVESSVCPVYSNMCVNSRVIFKFYGEKITKRTRETATDINTHIDCTAKFGFNVLL